MSASSDVASSPAIEVALVTAENRIAPGATSISAGLDMSLSEGWKTYWRSPGEVGLPPELDFTGSVNVAEVEILWPAPHRFTAFGIQNFGYSGEVVLPIRIHLERPGEAVNLRVEADILVCSEICVPSSFAFAIDLPAGGSGTQGAIDRVSAARIATFAALVPLVGPTAEISDVAAFVNEDARTLTITASGTHSFETPDVFPEMGSFTAFGEPDIRLAGDGRGLWAQLPILSLDPDATAPVITLTDGALARTIEARALETSPPAPFARQIDRRPISALVWIGLISFLGGLILNVMPCVLPVLSIKLASVITSGNKTGREIRASFLASAVGVMAFMWVLAAATFALRQIGVTVGWGLQFQNPGFLALMVGILAVFAANMLGLFEISLPSRLQTRLAGSGAQRGYAGDIATGAFAAMLATPCSAPFLGTAIAFALTGGIVDIGVVFTGLGLGLATPYFAVAAYPRLALMMPKPGRWMIVLKAVLGLLLLLTAAWLVWVLSGVAGPVSVLVTVGLIAALISLLAIRRVPSVARWVGVAVLAVAPVIAAGQLADQGSTKRDTGTEWAVFDRAAIARHVSRGEVVFVDVTADWCLTCQANKLLVLDRDSVAEALAAPGVTAMRADWTRPDEQISRYLAAFDRYGIPFNAVYGPGAPNGIALPELLSAEAVLEALREAETSAVAAAN
ncbi:protein-disulfide reductase DsbD family protein [Nioella nitratireducens]|uniref:protein-disulfide reductase DsbD family protein n=1 Tax=Nioella nitratireducens TaxID=1287720 RepID=UPI001F1C0578|nr:protein-disulfide reductase DsbD domain-containing protein [Nioella nitratireducens]